MSLEGRVIGVVEDDPLMGESLLQSLTLEGAAVTWWQTGQEAIQGMRNCDADLIVCDIRLPDTDGIALFSRAAERGATPPFIFMTAYGNVDQAVQLMRAGAEDYITKPFEISELLRRIDTIIPQDCDRAIAHPLGVSNPMRRIQQALESYARSPRPLLITGEIGVGKEYCARFLHQLITKGKGAFVSVNCAAVPEQTLADQLFGRDGRHGVDGDDTYLDRAAGGTLFIDGVAQLAGSLQARLVELIEQASSGAEQRSGAARSDRQALIIASTRRDLDELVARRDFREDLRNLLDPTHLHIPALRDRPEDIAWHLDQCLQEFQAITVSNVRGISAAAEAEALQHGWPRNVAELRRRMERAMALAIDEWISPIDLFPERGFGGWKGRPNVTSLAEARSAAERRHIERALSLHDGHLTNAAKTLGISRTTLWEKMKRLGLDAEGYS